MTRKSNKSFERTARQLACHQSCVVSFRLSLSGGQPLNSGVSCLPGIGQDVFRIIHGLASRPFIMIVMLAMGVSLIGCSQSQIAPTPIIPADWRRIELSRYSVSVPPDIGSQTFDRTDSEIWHAENGTMKLACDYGHYSTDLKAYANQPEYRRVVSYRRERSQGRNSAYERWRCALGPQGFDVCCIRLLSNCAE